MEMKIILISLVLIPILGLTTNLNIYEIGAIWSCSALLLASIPIKIHEIYKEFRNA